MPEVRVPTGVLRCRFLSGPRKFVLDTPAVPDRVLLRRLLDPGRGPALLVRRLAALLKRRVAHAGSRQALASPNRRLVRGGRLVLMCQGRERPVPAGMGECWVAVGPRALRDGEGTLRRGLPAAVSC